VSNDQDKIAYAKLPLVGNIPQPDKRMKIMELLERLDTITTQKAALLVLEDETKDELEQLQKETGKIGFRHGWLTFCSQIVKGRKTLDKMLLLENGCPASVLNSSYKTGESYVRNTFKHLNQEDE
jgi:hypothetical protein